ncbi:MAG: CBS domain-containing protein [Halobaculum sp.]
MLVRDIMTDQFETVSRDRTLAAAVEAMLREEVAHVFVVEDGTPAALITRRKALTACYQTDDPLSGIPLSGFSRGLETQAGPGETVLLCVGRLRAASLDCLPVVDGLSVEGILTKDDVIDNLSNITDETLEQEQRRRDWTQ